MSGFLFHDIIFGPVKSRRLGNSLGINLLPVSKKYCSFNCVYCECGWTTNDPSKKSIVLPKREEICHLLEQKLKNLTQNEFFPDNLTFAGNGEPTIHPDFHLIIKDTIALRDIYFPKTKITVLSNSSTIHKKEIFNALQLVDQNILKLDAGSQIQFERINKPQISLKINNIVNDLIKFKGELIIQTIFLKGVHNNKIVDNTTELEIQLWLNHIQKIMPKLVMIYSIDRPPPAKNLKKISTEKLHQIADKVNQIGIKTKIF